MTELPIKKEEEHKMRVCVKISAKGVAHGEYSFKGNDARELSVNGDSANTQMMEHINRWNEMNKG